MNEQRKLRNEIEVFVTECVSKNCVFESNGKDYNKLDGLLIDFFEPQFLDFKVGKNRKIELPFFGNILWPDQSFGNLYSSCFFSITEFLVWINYVFPRNYNSMWDVGAHMGIDTILMGKKSKKVTSFEPDKTSFDALNCNINTNQLKSIMTINAGLSYETGTEKFVKVRGNTTANHILGTRNSYGELEYDMIDLVNFKDYDCPEFAKINIEGYEKLLFKKMDEDFWDKCETIVEIHSEDCMRAVHDVAKHNSLSIYPQKIGFKRSSNFYDFPVSNKEGYIVVSKKRNASQWFPT